MNRVFSVLVLLAAPMAFAGDGAAFLQSAPEPAPAHHVRTLRWIRRATLASACISGTVLDTWALHRLASYPNVKLSGPFIANGKPEYGELVGMFAGSCALSTFMQERHVFASSETRGLDLTYTFENVGSLGVSMWATDHFLSLSNQAAAMERVQPATLASGLQANR
jgi:hypothetical protein